MTGETDDAVVRGEASFEQTRFGTNKPEPYCLSCEPELRVLAANFKKTYFIFYGKHRSSNYKKLKPGIESKEPRTCKSGGLITAL